MYTDAFGNDRCSETHVLEILEMVNKENVAGVFVDIGTRFLYPGCHGRRATAEHTKNVGLKQNANCTQYSINPGFCAHGCFDFSELTC